MGHHLKIKISRSALLQGCLFSCKCRNGAILTFRRAFILRSSAMKFHSDLVNCLIDNVLQFWRLTRPISSQFGCNCVAISSFFVGLSHTFLPVLEQFRKQFLHDSFGFLIFFCILYFRLRIQWVGQEIVHCTANLAMLLLF